MKLFQRREYRRRERWEQPPGKKLADHLSVLGSAVLVVGIFAAAAWQLDIFLVWLAGKLSGLS